MPSDNDDTKSKREPQTSFSHISVGQTTPTPDDGLEDEELFEIDSDGVHLPDQEEEQAVDPGEQPPASPETEEKRSFSRHHHTEREDDAREYRAEDEDYSVDDLEPMPLVQKIVLFLVILAIIAGIFWVLKYYVGF